MIVEDGKILDISGKGIIKNNISAFIMEKMGFASIDTHFIEKLNMHEQMIKLVEIVPVHVKIKGFEGVLSAKSLIQEAVKRAKD